MIYEIQAECGMCDDLGSTDYILPLSVHATAETKKKLEEAERAKENTESQLDATKKIWII